MANARQLKILKMGARVWNVWRAVNRHVLLDLSGADLRGASLADIDLHGALLRNVDLSRVTLIGANLAGADLSEANLQGADLHGANLREAKLRRSMLRGIQLMGADLSEVNLRGADLTRANFNHARLGAADLSEADLTGADLSNASLHKANLNGAQLYGANLSRAYLNRANLSRADLSDANLSEADLWEADLWKANLRGARLNGADLTEANLSEVDLSYANLMRANLRGAVLSGALLSSTRLSGTDFMGANLAGADLRESRLSGLSLRGANLRVADLSQAFLDDADLSGADLRGANLEEAHLEGADLNDADLRGAYLRGADLRRAKFQRTRYRQFDLDRAIFKDPEPETGGIVVRANLPSYYDVVSITALDDSTFEATSKSSFFSKKFAEEVSFTAIYPKEGSVETWHTLLVYAHLGSALEAVRQDAQRFQDQLPLPKEVTSSSASRITRGTQLTIIPRCEGLIFNPQRVTLQWLEDYHRADFRFRADPALRDDAARGEINTYVGPILVGSLKLAMLFSDNDPAVARRREEHMRMYHQEDIFVSYSHKDTEVVLACQKAYEALGFNVLIDRDTLRSGQVWNERLRYMINTATIFQLFWSQNSCQSEYCRQEWQHALKREKDGFIRPVYWEIPMPEPPEELSKYHFEYMQL